MYFQTQMKVIQQDSADLNLPYTHNHNSSQLEF